MERGVTRRQVKTMNIRKCLPAVAGFFIAAAALAARHDLPTPSPSEYVDAESSVNVPLPTNEGRHIRLTLAFDPSPTNALQVAFGIDSNHDGDLAPEETALRVGCDCGAPFVDGRACRSPHLAIPSGACGGGYATADCGIDNSISGGQGLPALPLAFALKQPKAVRWDLAKVTTHNIADTNVTVTANFYKTGFALILR